MSQVWALSDPLREGHCALQLSQRPGRQDSVMCGTAEGRHILIGGWIITFTTKPLKDKNLSRTSSELMCATCSSCVSQRTKIKLKKKNLALHRPRGIPCVPHPCLGMTAFTILRLSAWLLLSLFEVYTLNPSSSQPVHCAAWISQDFSLCPSPPLPPVVWPVGRRHRPQAMGKWGLHLVEPSSHRRGYKHDIKHPHVWSVLPLRSTPVMSTTHSSPGTSSKSLFGHHHPGSC